MDLFQLRRLHFREYRRQMKPFFVDFQDLICVNDEQEWMKKQCYLTKVELSNNKKTVKRIA